MPQGCAEAVGIVAVGEGEEMKNLPIPKAVCKPAVPMGSATPDAEYDVICGDECIASASGPKEDAWREATHYAQQYQADGAIVIWEVTRRKVWTNDKAHLQPPDGNGGAQNK